MSLSISASRAYLRHMPHGLCRPQDWKVYKRARAACQESPVRVNKCRRWRMHAKAGGSIAAGSALLDSTDDLHGHIHFLDEVVHLDDTPKGALAELSRNCVPAFVELVSHLEHVVMLCALLGCLGVVGRPATGAAIAVAALPLALGSGRQVGLHGRTVSREHRRGGSEGPSDAGFCSCGVQPQMQKGV